MSETPETGWPGGWYIYENGKVDGPYSAPDAFSLGAETSEGKPRLVSRKGFSQWYALKDLSEIFRMTESLGRKMSSEQSVMEAQLARFKADAAAATPLASAVGPSTGEPTPALEPAVDARPALPPKAQAKAPAQESPAPNVSVKPRVTAKLVQTKAEPRALPATKPSRRLDTGTTEVAKAKATPKAAKVAINPEAKAMQQTMQEYFLQQKRLRLGKIRNPWVTAFVGAPLSLFVYWVVWVAAMNREISWHAKNEHAKSIGLAVLAAIPLVHIFAIYKLASAMRGMEDQNRYGTVSPGVACLFGIFPPFAMAYLQDAANRHWLLHARYSQARTTASASA